ncbi:hypothetical protein MITS9509_01155 [Synechococcus sp. MIT S9509]|uniref:hypothetical protein n=1 Tax=unclassified Synechococcus TaxID=2626047 RepID=UPI0007BB28D1|nr:MULTISPECIES: hypothetical protein [unclassified Synechococcus]KZR87305.1 hypothetical protein MITS9504_00721 [Synechococcus sp. MIT S9504]KZR92706.1 hypothetical protein MITS9509_01155 [Synechococcus sp. MIT S9509]
MSFDPRSLERLRQLGRQLPEAIPAPATETKRAAKDSRPRHKVETEQDPKALFHELMQVSQDGTVPEHLIARLRDAEERVDSERRQQRNAPSTVTKDSAASPSALPTRSTGKGKNTRPQRRDVIPGSEEDSLYVAFGQMFLEEQDDEMD